MPCNLGLFKELHDKFCEGVDALKDSELESQLMENISEQYGKCYKLFQRSELRFNQKFSKQMQLDELVDDTIDPSDSASQVTKASVISHTSSVLKRIELERKKVELDSLKQLSLSRAKEAEVLAKLRIEKANIEAQEKLLECSQQSSRVSRPSKTQTCSRSVRSILSDDRKKSKTGVLERKTEFKSRSSPVPETCAAEKQTDLKTDYWARSQREILASTSLARGNENVHLKPQVAIGETEPELTNALNRPFNTNSAQYDFYRCFNGNENCATDAYDRDVFNDVPRRVINVKPDVHTSGRRPVLSESGELGLHAYLRRQGRNEYINLASQIAYDGANLAFIFCENQIRRLMDESAYDERRLEVLRASCTGQPREMVNLFCAPMKGLTTSQRIEKALNRLRQRYGVSGGLSSEPKVMAIRNAAKVANDLPSLKLFNEDLNTLEVFAFAHDDVDKLSGQLLFDIANRLPGILKRRYLDFLDKKGLNLSHPGFESLRKFVAHEIKVMMSDCAQAFFGCDGKDGQMTSRSKNYRVRQVTMDSGTKNRLHLFSRLCPIFGRQLAPNNNTQ